MASRQGWATIAAHDPASACATPHRLFTGACWCWRSPIQRTAVPPAPGGPGGRAGSATRDRCLAVGAWCLVVGAREGGMEPPGLWRSFAVGSAQFLLVAFPRCWPRKHQGQGLAKCYCMWPRWPVRRYYLWLGRCPWPLDWARCTWAGCCACCGRCGPPGPNGRVNWRCWRWRPWWG